MEISILNASLNETVSFLKKQLHLLNFPKGKIHYLKNEDCYIIISDNTVNLDFDIKCELDEIKDIELIQVNNQIWEDDITDPKEELNFNIPKIL